MMVIIKVLLLYKPIIFTSSGGSYPHPQYEQASTDHHGTAIVQPSNLEHPA